MTSSALVFGVTSQGVTESRKLTAMKMYCFVLVLLLAIAMGSRLSLATRESSSVPGASSLGRELREFLAKAGGFLSSAGRAGADGWDSAAATDVGASERSLRGGTAGRRKRLKKASVSCIPADMCRRKKVLCGKRCYRSSRAGASLNHVSSNKCVVRCKKCVATC